MRGCRVLRAEEPCDRREWRRLLAAHPSRPPMADPAYVAAMARPGQRALCPVYYGEHGAVFLPLIRRPLAQEEWGAGLSGVDLCTPYGYGGAYAIGQPPVDRFWDELEEWARAEGAVSIFARISPVPGETLPWRGETHSPMRNVIRTLDAPIEAIWRDYEHKVRKNVNRARSLGVQVEFDPVGARLDEFLDVYTDTMDRRGAGEGFYFPRSLFEGLFRDMPEACAFFHALHDGRVVSTELILFGARDAYSFLGGTRRSAFELRPNDLLKHTIVQWAIERGLRSYVLGAGPSGEDGIFRYKRSFAPTGAVPFFVGTRSLDERGEARALAARRDFESANGLAWTPEPGYFPAYRAPNATREEACA